jgi:Ni/Co efflux regulator RcnB
MSWLAAAMLAAAGAAGAAQKAAAPAAAAASAPAAQPAPGKTMGYGVKMGGYFTDEHKQVARKFFATKYAKGECPEGLRRDGKVCKQEVAGNYWVVGQTLQKAVHVYPLPPELLEQLPPPPEGYEYVRASGDILLVSKGLHLVVDILDDVAG